MATSRLATDTRTPLQRKEDVAREFVARLVSSRIADCVTRVLLFGSTLRGDAREDSDIDLLVVAGGDIERVREQRSDLSFDLLLDSGELVSPLVYCVDEYRDPAYFVALVKRSAREVYTVSDETVRTTLDAGPG
jgi:predicted nucleotidyltransferase